ncbi:alkylation response protein AidB-like acyl-CoA dehydrogenase [Streptomyces sp. Amel2xB2]|uniref:acyl-CoA dehydrogenase family protein n=1 Tax=Streptomyces sp. Amel2xB2 TaxID=1305829 RepID=UPI000DBFD4B4|nr:acyl-CoA dehydrogenase family protein [Streptomyces sp. Amel2xB2]RAJ58355.1 alkylation response protein AidB-like acyl-CoA dehydrogenase [Streptomyces sp. Amel2xB2]
MTTATERTGPSGRALLPPWEPGRLPEVTRALAERADGHDRDGSFPHEGFALVHEAGLLTATVAARHGGPEAGLADTVRILRALGAGDPSVALVTAMTLFTHAAETRTPGWPAATYRDLLDEAAVRPTLLNALRVEPELGSPVRGGLPATIARRSGGSWALSGRKIYSTGAVGLSRMLVFARTDEDPVRVGTFLVRGDSPGVRVEETWDHVGLRASRSDDVILDAVHVPSQDVLGLAEAGGIPGARPDPVTAAWNALGLTALYLGVAGAARDWLAGFLHERVPASLGRPLASVPRFETAVGEIETALFGADTLVDALAARVDAGDPEAAAGAGAAKLLGTRAAVSAVEEAVRLVGNHGLTKANPLQRHYRDVLCSRVHTPQDDSILTDTGRAVLSRHEPATAPKGSRP